MRKKIVFALVLAFLPLSLWGLTQGTGNQHLSTTGFMLDVDNLFPSARQTTSDNGINNIADFVTNIVPLLTTMMAIGATLMVILGGFHMVMGGANSEQTEKGKGMLKDALIGLLIGLLAYVIIMTLGNILGV